MSDRILKKSPTGISNRPTEIRDVDENLDSFPVNRVDGLTFLDVLFKPVRHSFEQVKVAKPELDDVNDPVYTVHEAPLGTLSGLVLNVTLKPQSIPTTKVGSKNETDPPSKQTRSNSTTRPSNIPTLRPSKVAPTVRSSSAPKKAPSASPSFSISSPKRTISRSLTPVSRKTPSRSPTPTKIGKTTSTIPSIKKPGDPQRSRSLTPKSKPLITSNSASSSSKTHVRSTSVTSLPSASSKPRTPPRLKETVILAFGRPVGTTTGKVNSTKRTPSPDVARTRPKVHPSSSPSRIPALSNVSHATTTPKSVKSSTTIMDSTRTGRKVSKASIQIANNHLDVSNAKKSTSPFSSTMLYPHSIRPSTLRKQCNSEGSSSSNHEEEEEGKSLTKEENMEKMDSARYEALLNVEDVKDTNWLLNLDDETNPSVIFDNAFDSPPEPFSPL